MKNLKKNAVLLIAVCAGAIILVTVVALMEAIVKNPVAGKISTLEFVVEITKALAWPAAFVFFVTMFQDGIRNIVGNIKKLVLPGGASVELAVFEKTSEASAALDVERSARELAQVVPPAPDAVQPAEPAADNAAIVDHPVAAEAQPLPGGATKLAEDISEEEPELFHLDDQRQLIRLLRKYRRYREEVQGPRLWYENLLTDPTGASPADSLLQLVESVLRSVRERTSELWAAALPESPPSKSSKVRWAQLRQHHILTETEHRSLLALLQSRNELVHVFATKEPMSGLALESYMALGERLGRLLKERTVKFSAKSKSQDKGR